MTPLHLPRRFRRRLLLPLGWVALGFLLSVSCWLLGKQPKRWYPQNIVQLTMPPLRPDTAFVNLYRRADKQSCYTEYSPYTDINDPQAITKIARMRPWCQYELTNKGHDSVELVKIEVAVKAIQADTGHAGGVRVRLGQRAPYRELVALLDMMLRLDQKRYWLDIVHQPTTFYAITPRPLALRERQEQQQVFMFECGYGYKVKEPPLTFSQKINTLQQAERRPLVLVTISSFVLLLLALVGQWLLR